MDPSIGWYQPEQQGPALQLWERIMDGVTENHDYIPINGGNPSAADKYSFAKDKPKVNRAATYALNRNSHIIVNYGGTPWRKPGKIYSRGGFGLHEEIEDFYEYIRPTRTEHRLRQKVVNRINELVKQIWPKAQCEVFGSFCTGLYLPTSDIDLVILGEWETLPMHTLKKALIQEGITTESNIIVLDKATVPIIKLTEQSAQVKVDISFNQRNGVKSAKLIKDFCEKFPPLPKLVFVLKQYLLQRDLNEVFTGGISSYSLILLIVSFLQLHPRQSEVRSSSSTVNLGILLLEFLELYGRYFNYAEVGIRIKGDGCLMPKDKLQREMALAQGQNPGAVGSIHDTSSILCIEDPLTPGNDIGRSSYGALNVQKAFDYAFMTLEQAVHPSFQAMIDPKQTILGRINRITDTVIDYRAWLDTTVSTILRTRASSSLEELNDSQDEVELSHRLPRPHREQREQTQVHSNGHYRHSGSNINNNNNNNHLNNNNNRHRYTPSNGSESWDSGKRSLSVYPSSGNGESCSSSLSSVASDKNSWHDEEEYEESRSDVDPESSDCEESQVNRQNNRQQSGGQHHLQHQQQPQQQQHQQHIQQQQQMPPHLQQSHNHHHQTHQQQQHQHHYISHHPPQQLRENSAPQQPPHGGHLNNGGGGGGGGRSRKSRNTPHSTRPRRT